MVKGKFLLPLLCAVMVMSAVTACSTGKNSGADSGTEQVESETDVENQSQSDNN